MNNSNNLLILNLGKDTHDTSLGFTQTWIEALSKEYSTTDVITMRLGKSNLSKDINVYFINENQTKLSKIRQYIKIQRTFKEVLRNKHYKHCFAHMSPLLLLIGKFYLWKRKIKTTLWFTHPGPKLSIKKFILLAATMLANNIVTASNNSFPYKVKKLKVIGHGVDFSRFEKTNKKQIKKFLYLGRISSSKHVEVIIENFIRFNASHQNNFSLTLIGGPLNKEDENYLSKIKKSIGDNQNIDFLGKIPHKELKKIVSKFDCNINLTGTGFFDKAVLETLHAGLINICYNEDYKQFFSSDYQDKLFIKSNLNELEKIFETVVALNQNEIESIIKDASGNLNKHSLLTLPKRLMNVFND